MERGTAMRIHITSLYGMGGTVGKAQHMVADIAKRDLHFNELGIYKYPMHTDTADMLRTRLDGIVASVGHGDIVIFQMPTWNSIAFDEGFVAHLGGYRDLKKIFFLHDVPPLMDNRALKELDRYIALYNRADLMILPSQNMADFLYSRGLTVKKTVIQRMWDAPVDIDLAGKPPFRRRINFAADVVHIPRPFVQIWKSDVVELAVTAPPGEYAWAEGKNICYLGWFTHENLLADALRKSGGFGLLWHDDPVWIAYMKQNACCKLGTYLAAGLPVIVHSSIPEAVTIHRKNLGLVVDFIEEAVERVALTTKEEYEEMAQNVNSFGYLARNGYFARKLLTDAVFQLLYE